MLSNLNEMYDKEYMMEVATDVVAIIKVLNEKTVLYQFISFDEEGHIMKDAECVTDLEVAYDEIEGRSDYSFFDGIATRFYLFTFEPVESFKDCPVMITKMLSDHQQYSPF